MPIDPNIARGTLPLGSDLLQIASMIEDRRRSNENQRLAQRRVDLDAGDLKVRQQQQQTEATKERSKEELTAKYAEVAALEGAPPNIKAAYLDQQRQQHPEFAQTPFAQMNPDQAITSMRQSLGAQLGHPVDKPDKPPEDPLSHREYLLGQQDPAYAASLVKRDAAKGTNISVDTGKKFGEVLAGKQAEQYSTLYDQAQKAPELINRATRVQALLKTGAYTGAAADWKLAFGKAAKTAGFDYGGSDAANTEALSQELAASTLDAIKASGLGGGTGFSNADRDFLERVVGGKITLERGTIGRLAALNQRSAKLTVDRWNTTSKRLSKSNPGMLEQLGMSTVDAPATNAAPAPSNGPVRVATPEEAMKLPPDTVFVTPDGRVKRRPKAGP